MMGSNRSSPPALKVHRDRRIFSFLTIGRARGKAVRHGALFRDRGQEFLGPLGFNKQAKAVGGGLRLVRAGLKPIDELNF